jgi:hypothetical protein
MHHARPVHFALLMHPTHLDAHEGDPAAIERMGNLPAKDRIAQTVRSLAAEACDMECRLTKDDAELLPCVVGGASRMQEMVIELLPISRFANLAGRRAPPRRRRIPQHRWGGLSAGPTAAGTLQRTRPPPQPAGA